MNNNTQNDNDEAPEQVDEAAEQDTETTEEVQAEMVKPHQATTLEVLEGLEGPQEVVAWLKTNATPILVGLVIAVLVFAGVRTYRNNQKTQELTAQSQLFNSNQSSQFADIVAKYPGTSSASLAELALGTQLFDEGKYDQARTTFSAFLQKYPQHQMAGVATVGLVECDEAQAKPDAALAGYDNFMKSNKDSFLYPQAMFGKGRCLTQLGRFDDARALFEDYITAHPDDQWVARVQTELMYVAKAKRAAPQKPVAAPMTIAPPAAPAPAAVAPAVVPAVK